MSIIVRKAADHGKTKLDWLESSHGFSFGKYYNPSNMNFGKLIVFNDDIVKAGKGFGSHSHENAEIFSFVLKGNLEHKDSGGNHGLLEKYDIQRISAGSGIIHSEFNPSKENDSHFLQIWLKPRNHDSKPSYEQRSYKELIGKNGIFKLVCGEVGKNLIYVDQDAIFYVAQLGKETTKVEIGNGRGLYIYVLEGNLEVGSISAQKGDSVEIKDMKTIPINSLSKSKFVMLDVSL